MKPATGLDTENATVVLPLERDSLRPATFQPTGLTSIGGLGACRTLLDAAPLLRSRATPFRGAGQLLLEPLPYQHMLSVMALRLNPVRLFRQRLEEGTIDGAAVYPRRMIESVLRQRAEAIIFNHIPTGHVQPTEQDKVFTRSIGLAAEGVHVKIVDHLNLVADE